MNRDARDLDARTSPAVRAILELEDEAPDFAFFDLPVALGIINWRELIQNHKSDD